MSIPSSNQSKLFAAVLLIEDARLPRILKQIDGISTGLNAIGLAIIEAGSSGVYGLAVSESVIAWHVQPDTPDGVYFAWLCMRAARGKSLPSVEQALKIVRPFLVSNNGRYQ